MTRLSTLSAADCLERSASALSNVSATTYHSFQDIELYEPGSGQPDAPTQDSGELTPEEDRFEPAPRIRGNAKRVEMKLQRHDSGYESIPSRSRSNISRAPKENRYSTCSMPPTRAKTRSHPSIRRAASTRAVAATGSSSYVLFPPPRAETYYHFPALDGFPGSHVDEDEDEDKEVSERSYPPPPQTTHYWTSDHTRRLEYAAIDAASRGVKGWFMKHVIPDCFVPKGNRRVGFDDDSGSVRRYRLELECEEVDEKKGATGKGKKMGWLIGR